MSIAALIRSMSAAGAPAEAIAIAVEALEAADARLSDIRAGARDRKRAQREREAAERAAADGRDCHVTVTGQSRTEPAPSPLPSPLTPIQPHTPTRKPTPVRRREAEAFPKPDFASDELWADFLANRRKKGLPNTATAHRKLMADIDRHTDDAWPPGRLLEAVTGRGWGAIYPSIKDDDDGLRGGRAGQGMAAGRNGRATGGRSGDGFIDALREDAG